MLSLLPFAQLPPEGRLLGIFIPDRSLILFPRSPRSTVILNKFCRILSPDFVFTTPSALICFFIFPEIHCLTISPERVLEWHIFGTLPFPKVFLLCSHTWMVGLPASRILSWKSFSLRTLKALLSRLTAAGEQLWLGGHSPTVPLLRV